VRVVQIRFLTITPWTTEPFATQVDYPRFDDQGALGLG
jgi:hypothetical protein